MVAFDIMGACMKNNGFLSLTLHGVRVAATSLAVLQMSAGQVLAAAPVATLSGPSPAAATRSVTSAH